MTLKNDRFSVPLAHFTAAMALLLGSFGCAHRAQESDKAPGAPVSVPAPQEAERAAPSPAEEANEVARTPHEKSDEAAKKATAVVAPNRQKPLRSAPMREESRVGAKSAAPSLSEREVRSSGARSDSLDIPKQPAFAESPELSATLKEFDAELERLSTSQDCAEICRAYDSLRRCAERICELSPSADPRERCRNAKTRLEQATRDVTGRCPSCR